MSTYGPLPHIIGSEEYNHDNSCGLADDVQPLTDDFSWLREFQGESLDSGAADLLESQMLGVQRGLEKGQTDSLVSAAREFKAMLEAALVNPYKLYDASVENTNTSEVHHNTDPVMLTGTGEAAHERSTEADNSEEAGLLASLQNPYTNAHDLYSALVREGLFDTGDENLSMDAMESAGTSISVPTSGLANPAIAGSAERTFSINENFPNEENLTEPSNNHEEDGHKDEHAASPPEQKDGVSGSS